MLFDLMESGEDQYCYSWCSIPIQPFSYSAGYTGIVMIIRLLPNTFEPHVTNTQDSIFCQVLWLFVGADPNTCDDEGRSALYLMIDQGGANPVILKELLKAGASPNKATWSLQQTPLHVAARRGYQV